jgi:hypothetical protein
MLGGGATMAARKATVDHFFPEADFAEIERRLREIPAVRRPRLSRSPRRSPRGSMLGLAATLTVGFGVAIPTSSIQPSNLGNWTTAARGGSPGAQAGQFEAPVGRTIGSEPLHSYARGFIGKGAYPQATGSVARSEPASVPSRFMHASLSAGLGLFGLPVRP